MKKIMHITLFLLAITQLRAFINPEFVDIVNGDPLPIVKHSGPVTITIRYAISGFEGCMANGLSFGGSGDTTEVGVVKPWMVNYSGVNPYPYDFKFPDGSSIRDSVMHPKYYPNGYPYSKIIEAGLRDFYSKMSGGEINLVFEQYKNPNHPYGAWISKGASAEITQVSYVNNRCRFVLNNPIDVPALYTKVIYFQTRYDKSGGSSDYANYQTFKTNNVYTWFIYGPGMDFAAHELGHSMLNLIDRGNSGSGTWNTGIENRVFLDFNKNGTFEADERMGQFWSNNPAYDLMFHNGAQMPRFAVNGIVPFHTFDLINNGLIKPENIHNNSESVNRQTYRVKAVRQNLSPIEKDNGIKSVLKIPFAIDENYAGAYVNNSVSTNSINGDLHTVSQANDLGQQYFLVEYRDGSGYDQSYKTYNNTQSNTGVLITHVIDDNKKVIDVEIANSYPKYNPDGSLYRNPTMFDEVYPNVNGKLYNAKLTTNWTDDYIGRVPYIIEGGTHWHNDYYGQDSDHQTPWFYKVLHSQTLQSDFFNATNLNKFTPSTSPGSESWFLQDTHIGIYIKSISGEYADIAVYRNYWSRPLSEATTTINQNCFFGENFTVAAGQILEIGNNLTACVVEKGTFTVKSGATLKIGSNSYLNIENRCNFILEPGATVEMGENAAINANTQANIYAVGTADQPITIRNPRTGTLWNGISSGFSGGLNGDMNLQYCNIIGMLNGISGAPSIATVSNCHFGSIGTAINLANCNKANITDNIFYGRDTFNTAITLTQSIGSIERNQITGFGTGIKVISSSPNIVANDISGNAICGLTSDGINGKPLVTRNNIYNNGNTATGQKAQIEIYETSNVYLANGNNNIYGALNSSGTPFVPCIQKNSTAAMRALNATGNYWGSSSVNNSFFKPVNGSWIIYSPYSATAYNNKSGGDATPENLLLTTGLAAQKTGDLTTAENSFSALITKFADTPESYQAAAALLENYLLGNQDLNKLLTQYAALGASSSWTDSRFFAEMTFKTLLSQQNNTAAFAKATELFNSAANDREKILARIDQFLSASSDNKAQNLGNTNLNALLIMLDNGKFTDLAGETLNNNLPANYRLYNSYPNPFNPSTTIKFDLPVNSLVKLAVYDVAGRQVAVLANGILNGGTHSMEFNSARLASGVYFYQLEAEGKIIGRNKMMLLK